MTGLRIESRRLMLLLLAIAIVETCAVFIYYVRFPTGDFDAYLNAAQAVRAGSRIYETALIWRDAGYTNSAPVSMPTETTPYIYPPFLALLMIPFTLLPHSLAHALWCVVIVASVAGAAVVIGRMLSGGDRERALLLSSAVAIVLFVSQPVRASLTSKQVDGMVLLLMALSLLAFSKRRDTLAGIWFGLAIAIKPFVVLATLFYLWKGGWRTTVVAAIVSAAIVLLPFPLMPPGTFEDYLAGTQFYAGPVYGASPMGQSIYSVLVRAFTVNPFAQPIADAPWLILPLRLVLSGLVLIFAMSQITRRRTVPATTLTLEHGLVVAAGLLVIPLAEDFHFTYMAAAFAAGLLVLLTELARGRRPGWLTILFIGYLGVLCLPALRLVSHAFYRYGDGPVGFPLSALMNFQALLLLLGVLLIAGALRVALRGVQSGRIVPGDEHGAAEATHTAA